MGENRKQGPNLKLIGLRVNAGLSPRELAYFTGLSAPTIRSAEAGGVPRPRVQRAIADYFELEPLDLWPVSVQAAAQKRSEGAAR